MDWFSDMNLGSSGGNYFDVGNPFGSYGSGGGGYDFDFSPGGYGDFGGSYDFGGGGGYDFDNWADNYGGGSTSYDYGNNGYSFDNYSPSYDFGGGGGGYDWGGTGGAFNEGAWWAPSGGNQGSGTGYNAPSGSFGAGGFDSSNMMPGTGPVGEDAVQSGTGNGGVTGSFGGAGVQNSQKYSTPDLSAWGSGGVSLGGETGTMSAGSGQGEGGGGNTSVSGPGQAQGKPFWNSDKLLGLGIEGAKLFAAQQAGRKGDKYARMEAERLQNDSVLRQQQVERENAYREEQMAMQRRSQAAQMAAAARSQAMQEEAFATQKSAMTRNNANADYWNTQATQSADEARSLYNPQELGLRGYSQATAGAARQAQAARDSALQRGMSPAAAEAEARRARVAGSAGAATAYASGLDRGRTSTTGAMSSAAGLARQYAGVNSGGLSLSLPNANVGGMPNGGSGGSYSALADYYNRQGGNVAGYVGDVLNVALDYPGLTDAERLRRMRQEGSK